MTTIEPLKTFNAPLDRLYAISYHEPTLDVDFTPTRPRSDTLEMLVGFNFQDDKGESIQWSPGQIEIIDCILHRSSPNGLQRIEIIASTQYGKSLAVAAGVVMRASAFSEKWAIVAGTTEKAKIIMEYVIMLALSNPPIRKQLDPETPIDKLRMKRSADRLVFKKHGEVRVYSAEAKLVAETSKSLMGFGCLVEGMKVMTDKGEIEISELVKNKTTNKVWSYNHEKHKVELQKILEYQDNPRGDRELLEIDTGDSKFVCTEDHPVWVEGKGYIRSDEVKKGDVVWVLD